jgi:hypothetical protein
MWVEISAKVRTTELTPYHINHNHVRETVMYRDALGKLAIEGSAELEIYIRSAPTPSGTRTLLVLAQSDENQVNVQHVFKIPEDLMSLEPAPIEVLERFANRFGHTFRICSTSGRFLLAKRVSLSAEEDQTNTIPIILPPGRPEGFAVVYMGDKGRDEQGSFLNCALAFAVDTRKYRQWAG